MHACLLTRMCLPAPQSDLEVTSSDAQSARQHEARVAALMRATQGELNQASTASYVTVFCACTKERADHAAASHAVQVSPLCWLVRACVCQGAPNAHHPL